MIMEGVIQVKGILAVDAGMPLLIGGALHLCLVQIPERNLDAVKEDRSAETSLRIIRELLGEDGHLRKMWPSNRPATVLMPEYSFGSGDWAAVDQAVRGSAGPLVLITGFGVVKGKWFADWVKGGGPNDERILAVGGDDQQPAENATYAGGWCWIKRPDGTTRCVAFIKNHLEQDVEYTIVSDYGESIARIDFEDTSLFPLLCADCLCEKVKNPLARIKKAIEDCGGNVLITASLWQDKPHHPRWQQAFNTLFADRTKRIILALSNQAIDRPAADEEHDCWRSLSGIIFPPLHPTTADSDDAVRPVTRDGNNYVAAMLRRSDPCVTIGKLYWPPYGSGTSRQPWTARTVYPLSSDGKILKEVPTDRAFYELERFVKRHCRAPGDDIDKRLALGMDRVKTKLPAFPANVLHETILSGLDRSSVICPDQMHNQEAHLLEGMFSLAHLLSHPDCDWQENTGLQGQVRISDKSTTVLVWRSKFHKRELKRQIQTWQIATPGHPPIVILNRCSGLDFEGSVMPEVEDVNESVQPEARSDVGSPHYADSQGRIITARQYPKVNAKSLGYVVDSYAENDTPDELIKEFKSII